MICKACRDKRCHTKVEWRNHPLAGHGYEAGRGWSHPEAERLHNEEAAPAAAMIVLAKKPSLNLSQKEART